MNFVEDTEVTLNGADDGSSGQSFASADVLFRDIETLDELLAKVPPESHDLVRHAYDLASVLHEGQVRQSGKPYITHPLQVASYLADLNMDADSIAAGLLHDVLEDTEMSREHLATLFPEPIPEIVQGVTKISRMSFQTTREAQVENLRIMILAMARDIRVVVVKLCDRLHNMKTLSHMQPEKRAKISRETMDIFAPLANRLGMSRIKGELEDLAMRWLYPTEYQQLASHVHLKKEERARIVHESIEFLRGLLVRHYKGRDIQISGRPKHFWSIYRKMQSQGLTFDQIYDLNALRILCENEGQCYEILGLIHSTWTPLPGRIKDYIGMPKKNLYQSLHTTVMGYKGNVTEIQIRTRQMHQVAEYGIAAHWKYKEQLDKLQMDDRLAWLRQLTEWITDVNEPDGLLDALKKDVFADRVMCFTPAGDVIELPANACPIDFAYAIHTKVGEHCVGAKINNRIVNLRSQLHNGDVVEIMTSTAGHPSRDWLDYATTGRARTKIKHWLKARNLGEWCDNGRKAIARVLTDRHIDITQAELDRRLMELLPAYKLNSVEDLLVEIGFGAISPQAAVARMNPDWAKAPRPAVRKIVQPPPKVRKVSNEPILVEGLEGVPMRIAQCCRPIPGDPIIAFVTRGRGVTIHAIACGNVHRTQADNDESERLLPATWNSAMLLDSEVRLVVEAHDREGLLNDLTGVFRRHAFFILECSTKSNMARKTATMEFKANVRDAAQIRAALEEIRAMDTVISAERRRTG